MHQLDDLRRESDVVSVQSAAAADVTSEAVVHCANLEACLEGLEARRYQLVGTHRKAMQELEVQRGKIVETHMKVMQDPSVEVQAVVKNVPRLELRSTERVVEVPRIEYKRKIVDVPEVRTVDKIVEVPQVEIQEVVKHVPCITVHERLHHVPKILVQERIRNVPVYVDEIVEKIIEVPEIKTVERIVEVPELHTFNKIVEVPQKQIVEVEKRIYMPSLKTTYGVPPWQGGKQCHEAAAGKSTQIPVPAQAAMTLPSTTAPASMDALAMTVLAPPSPGIAQGSKAAATTASPLPNTTAPASTGALASTVLALPDASAPMSQGTLAPTVLALPGAGAPLSQEVVAIETRSGGSKISTPRGSKQSTPKSELWINSTPRRSGGSSTRALVPIPPPVQPSVCLAAVSSGAVQVGVTHASPSGEVAVRRDAGPSRLAGRKP